MVEPLAGEPVADAELVQQVDRVLLEQPGADALLDVLAVARLEHDALDARALEQQGERQAGGSGADDADLRCASSGDASYTRVRK